MFIVLEEKLSNFVKNITKKRKESHGYNHMKKVAINAKIIMKDMKVNSKQYRNVLIVAWLHDVADHKYDKDGKLRNKLIEFIKEIEPDKKINKLILSCIDMISFTKEKQKGYKYYEKILPSEWIIIRNIASDADKLEALGEIGIERCKQYSQEKEGNQLSSNRLLKDVWEYCKEKILLLSSKYIHTNKGKELSKYLHKTTLDWLVKNGIKKEKLQKYYF